MARLYDGADPDKPDPNVDAQAAAVAKKNGFASLVEYDGASMNISIIMFGIDPQTKKFTEPPRSDQEADRGALNRQIRFGGRKEGGPGRARGSAQERKAHSVQRKHRAGAKVLRQTRAAHAGPGFEPTCGLAILLAAKAGE
jgi:hypothetical protein